MFYPLLLNLTPPPEPERPGFNVTPQVFTVGFDGDGFPIKGVSDSLDNLFEDSYTELRDLRIESVDNYRAVISDDGLRFSYIPSNGETQTVVMLSLSSVEDDRVSISIPYTLNFVDKSTDDLINDTINDLDIPENHKRLIRSLPNELNVFYRDGVNEYNIAKIEAVSYVFDRVERVTDVFMYEDYPDTRFRDNDPYSIYESDPYGIDHDVPIRTFSQDKIDSVARHAFALASVIDFNKDTIEYHDSDFQRVAEALSDVTAKALTGRDYEPFYGLSVDNESFCRDNDVLGARRYNSSLICINGVTYGLSELGDNYHEFVTLDQDFYLRNKGEDIAIQAIQDRSGNPINRLVNLSDEEFSYFHDNALLIGVRRRGANTGSSLSFGNLRFKSNADNVDIGTNFNIYNLARRYIGDSFTPQEAVEKILENRRDALHHFTGAPYLADSIGYPILEIEEVEALRNIYLKYDNVTNVSWVLPIFYLLPEELDGIVSAGSPNFSGVFSSVLKNINIPSVQVTSRDIFENKPRPINLSEIFSDFNNDGFPERILVEGNVTFGATVPDFCKTFIPYDDFLEVSDASAFRNVDSYCLSNN